MTNEREFYIETNSFAAPFFSDSGHVYVKANSAEAALLKAAAEYKHPCGLYAAVAYSSSDARNKGEKPLAKWLCNHEIAKQEATASMDAYTYRGSAPGSFEVDGRRVAVDDPKGGRVIKEPSNAHP